MVSTSGPFLQEGSRREGDLAYGVGISWISFARPSKGSLPRRKRSASRA